MTAILIIALIGIAALIATFRFPGLPLAVGLGAYGIQQALRAHVGFLAANHQLINLAIGIFLLLAIVIAVARNRFRLLPEAKAQWWIVSLLIYAFVSIYWSIEPINSYEVFRVALPTIGAFALLLPLTVNRLEDIHQGLLLYIIIGVLMMPFLIATNVQTRFIEFASGDKGNPLSVASAAGYLAIIVVMLNFRGAARILQAGRWFIFVLALLVIFRSDSRGQVIATMIGVIAMLPVSRNIKNIRGFIGLAVGLVLSLGVLVYLFDMYAGQSDRWEFGNMVSAFQEGRLGTTMDVLYAWAAAGPGAWLFGLGSSASYEVIGFYPHFVPGEVLGELGLIGFTMYSMVLIYSLRSVLQMRALLRDDPVERGILAAIAGVVLMGFVLTLKQGSLVGASQWLGLVMVLSRYNAIFIKERTLLHQQYVRQQMYTPVSQNMQPS